MAGGGEEGSGGVAVIIIARGLGLLTRCCGGDGFIYKGRRDTPAPPRVGRVAAVELLCSWSLGGRGGRSVGPPESCEGVDGFLFL